MNYLTLVLLLCIVLPFFSTAQQNFVIRFFPETTFVSQFTADANAHRLSVENILISKNVKTTLGEMFPVANIDLFGTTMQASIGGSVHFELHPIGQAQIVSNEYYVDFITLDIPTLQNYFLRFVSGHTSHHLSDNWYERLMLTTAVRYSRDYLRLFFIYEQQNELQWYFGVDYAYIATIGQRINKPWVFQAGGRIDVVKLGDEFVMYLAADSKIRHEANFAATNVIQCGITIPIQHEQRLRFAYQFRSGLDERGQFFPQHRTLHTLGFIFDK